MREPPSWFTRELKKIDPDLELRFEEPYWRLYRKLRAKDLQGMELRYCGELDGLPIFRMRDVQIEQGALRDAQGNPVEPTSGVLEAIKTNRAIKLRSRPQDRARANIEEAEEVKKRGQRFSEEMKRDMINRTRWGLTPKIFLGGK